MIPDTQLEAYRQIKPHRSTYQAAVLDYIKKSGGATDEEIHLALGFKLSSVVARRNELVSLGYVVDSGERRLSASNRRVIVWKSKGVTP